jgi:hypothetical protein
MNLYTAHVVGNHQPSPDPKNPVLIRREGHSGFELLDKLVGFGNREPVAISLRWSGIDNPKLGNILERKVESSALSVQFTDRGLDEPVEGIASGGDRQSGRAGGGRSSRPNSSVPGPSIMVLIETLAGKDFVGELRNLPGMRCHSLEKRLQVHFRLGWRKRRRGRTCRVVDQTAHAALGRKAACLNLGGKLRRNFDRDLHTKMPAGKRKKTPSRGPA